MDVLFRGQVLCVETTEQQLGKRSAWCWLQDKPYIHPAFALLGRRHLILNKNYSVAPDEETTRSIRSATLPNPKAIDSNESSTVEIPLSELENVIAFEDVEDDNDDDGYYQASGNPLYLFVLQEKLSTADLKFHWFAAPDDQSREQWIRLIKGACADLNTESEKEEGNKWEIDFSLLKMGDRIGHGAFGDVYQAELWGTDVAVKILKHFDPDSEEAMAGLDDLHKEVQIVSDLRHPNTVLYIGCTKPPHVSLITEWCASGTLQNVIHDYKSDLSLVKIIQYAVEIAQGMNYLHSLTPQLIHRDLKSENILVDHHKTMKVADFGLSYARKTQRDRNDNEEQEEIEASEHYGVYGTPEWMAPEIMNGSPYTEKVDIFSYGIILVEMVKRLPPYVEKNFAEGDFLSVVRHVAREMNRPTIPDWVPIQLKSLIQQCLQDQPSDRPNFEVILTKLRIFQQEIKGRQFFTSSEGPRLRYLLASKHEALQKAGANEISMMEIKGERSIFQLPKLSTRMLIILLTRQLATKEDRSYLACKALAELLHSKHLSKRYQVGVPKNSLTQHGCCDIILEHGGLQLICQILVKEEKKDTKRQMARVNARLKRRPTIIPQVERNMIRTLKANFLRTTGGNKPNSVTLTPTVVPDEVTRTFDMTRASEDGTQLYKKSPMQIVAEQVMVELTAHASLDKLSQLKDEEMSFIDVVVSADTCNVGKDIAKMQLKLENNRKIINTIRETREALPQKQRSKPHRIIAKSRNTRTNSHSRTNSRSRSSSKSKESRQRSGPMTDHTRGKLRGRKPKPSPKKKGKKNLIKRRSEAGETSEQNIIRIQLPMELGGGFHTLELRSQETTVSNLIKDLMRKRPQSKPFGTYGLHDGMRILPDFYVFPGRVPSLRLEKIEEPRHGQYGQQIGE